MVHIKSQSKKKPSQWLGFQFFFFNAQLPSPTPIPVRAAAVLQFDKVLCQHVALFDKTHFACLPKYTNCPA
jgi:hypothetical protein